jgi:hypothetical protein
MSGSERKPARNGPRQESRMNRTRLTQRLVPRLAALLAALAVGAPPALAAEGAGLPGGATSLRETY